MTLVDIQALLMDQDLKDSVVHSASSIVANIAQSRRLRVLRSMLRGIRVRSVIVVAMEQLIAIFGSMLVA